MKKTALILLSIALFSFSCRAQELSILSIPKEIGWVNTPLSWQFKDDALTLTGGRGSRLFVDPQGERRADSAPMALFAPDEHFLFSAKVKVDFGAVFDAGVLVVYADSSQWAKFCFEYAPDLTHMIVTVCNNRFSDDNNHIVTPSDEMYLRIAGLGGRGLRVPLFDGREILAHGPLFLPRSGVRLPDRLPVAVPARRVVHDGLLRHPLFGTEVDRRAQRRIKT